MKKYIFLLIVFAFLSCKEDTKKPNPELSEVYNTKVTGPVFGTSFSVIYNSKENYAKAFDSLFTVVNQSMSTYIPDSDISRLNRGESIAIDEHFKAVFSASQKVYQETDGVFDPTIGNVVNAWNFGAENNKFLTDSTTIDSLIKFVGLNKVKVVGNKVNRPDGTYIEFNAIAKGYGVDVIGKFLESKDINNYLVEIGGEIRSRGENKEKGSPWRVGLDEPRFDGQQSI